MNKIDVIREKNLLAQTVERLIRSDLAVNEEFRASRTLHKVLMYVEEVQRECLAEETEILAEMESADLARAGQPAERSEHE